MSGELVQAPMTAVFVEDWFSAQMCRTIARLVVETLHLGGDTVEIGSWEGKSTIALANAIYPDKLCAVDTWKGSPGEISRELAKERDVYATFLANIEAATKGNVVPFRMGWRRYVHDHQAPIRFCFIDAEHSYVEVRENIEAVLPRMVPGGILCGDDVHHPPIIRAVLDTVGDAQRLGTLWVHRCQ